MSTLSPNGNLLTGYVSSVSAENVAFTLSFPQTDSQVDSNVTYICSKQRLGSKLSPTDQIPFVVTARDDDNDETKLTLNVSVTDGWRARLVLEWLN
ncbi:hypothetical protein OK016_25180 [Vibrio chagasii]|nr:hypothetical protein [Vibrio chagasii]